MVLNLVSVRRGHLSKERRWWHAGKRAVVGAEKGGEEASARSSVPKPCRTREAC